MKNDSNLDISSDNLKNFNFVDALKFFLAILVVGIHTEPFCSNFWLDKGFGLLTRLSVPTFFVLSTYFIFLNANSEKIYKNVKKTLVRILILLLLWTLILSPFAFHFGIIDNVLNLPCKTPLWFLESLIIGIMILVCFRIVFSTKIILLIAVIELLVATIFSTYYNLFSCIPLIKSIYENFFSHLEIINGVFYGFPYLAIGMYIAEYKNNTSLKYNLFGFMASMAILAIESFVFVVIFKTQSTILWMSVFPATYFLVRIALSINLAYCSIYMLIRKLSIMIYTSHIIFVWILMFHFGIPLGIKLFLLTTLCSITFSVGIYLSSLNSRLAFLKYLY